MPVFRSPHPDILNYEAFAILNGSISSFIGLWLRLELAQRGGFLHSLLRALTPLLLSNWILGLCLFKSLHLLTGSSGFMFVVKVAVALKGLSLLLFSRISVPPFFVAMSDFIPKSKVK